jgi:DNA-binding HxlR family transcriptional regulator
MLSERLKELESEEVLTRTVFPEVPVRVEYRLTAKGRALEASIMAIGEWAERWVSAPDSGAPVRRVVPADARSGRATRRRHQALRPAKRS